MKPEKHPGLNEALEILLTSDGKGRKKKGEVLNELMTTCNPNWARDAIEEYVKENP